MLSTSKPAIYHRSRRKFTLLSVGQRHVNKRKDEQIHKDSYVDEKFLERHQAIDTMIEYKSVQNTNISNINATLEQGDHISSEENKTPDVKQMPSHFMDSKTELDYINEFDAERLITDVNDHYYYNYTTVVNEALAKEYWTSFKNISAHTLLSKSHRRAKTVQLSFDFPFYGQPIRNVTVTSGGFLYTGEYVHSWLAAAQYIAPLMANFDTSLSNDSFVKFADNGTAFTVIWENVFLQDREDIGSFTFSTTLHKNGDIVFAYFSVPILIASIKNDKHPVKIGVSDAYIIDKVDSFTRSKAIYEYHRVNFRRREIQNWTIIYLSAHPTCLGYTDCMSCLTHDTKFKCTWCPALNKCSTGTDRKRQDWLQKGCDRSQIEDSSHCPAIGQKGNNLGQETQNEFAYYKGASLSEDEQLRKDSYLDE